MSTVKEIDNVSTLSEPSQSPSVQSEEEIETEDINVFDFIFPPCSPWVDRGEKEEKEDRTDSSGSQSNGSV